MKKFKEFVNEGLFDSGKTGDFLSRFGSIITGDKYGAHVEEPKAPIESDGSIPPVVDIKSIGNALSREGTYSAPNLTLSSKYSTAPRVSGIVRDPSQIFQICLHHTDGENIKGEDVINYVYKKGAGYSVHYAIGRDGQLVQGSPENEAVWASNNLNTHSISIELGTGGGIYLKNSKWYDGEIQLGENYYPLIVDLGYTYNGYRYYLDYTDGQMKSLKEFIDMTIKKYPEIKKGISGNVYTKVFGIPEPSADGNYTSKKLTQDQANKDPGIYIHAIAPGATHVDCFPSSKLVELLKTYGYTGNVLESKYMYVEEEVKPEWTEDAPLSGTELVDKGLVANPLSPYLYKNKEGNVYLDKGKYYASFGDTLPPPAVNLANSMEDFLKIKKK